MGFVWVLPSCTRDCNPVKRTLSPLSGNGIPISSRTRLNTRAAFRILAASESRTVNMASSWPCSAQIAEVQQFVPARIIFSVRLA